MTRLSTFNRSLVIGKGLNPLDMRIHRDPLKLGQKCTQKCLETNNLSFGQLWVIQSSPLLKSEVRPHISKFGKF